MNGCERMASERMGVRPWNGHGFGCEFAPPPDRDCPNKSLRAKPSNRPATSRPNGVLTLRLCLNPALAPP
jgi:hypothetical protein